MSTHNTWTCAQWVIEIIRRLTEWQFMAPDIGSIGWESVYLRVVSLAIRYEQTKKAQMAGGIIPVIQYPFLMDIPH